MKLTLGYSPCPNDTFIFDALVNGKIDTGELQFETILEDVETLNNWALEGRLDITKLSFPAFFRSTNHYIILRAGSALGQGVGPLLISKDVNATADSVSEAVIAIPGDYTTANFLLHFAFPGVSKKVPMIFSSIENAVLSGEVDMGVIIHENRFTYHEKGLHKIADLGENWESKVKLPIPLGGIAVSQSLKRSTALLVNDLIRKSVAYAFEKYPSLPPYVVQHAQEMDEEIMRKHIDLYVNDYSLDLGMEGKKAIKALYVEYKKLNDREPDEVEGDELFL